jgi:NAD(P)-dependent dehydrogenase (short-subunit alcohol dehydrogenase family)
MDLGLSGRVAIVTGGSSGIGRATVRALIAEGCLVAACARRAERLASLAAGVGDSGRLLTMEADVTDAKAMQRLVGATVAEFGRIDAIAALAGRVFAVAEDWKREISNKIEGVLTIVDAARLYLARSDAARVATVTAPTARQPDPTMAAVSAARAAVANLTRTLALDLADDRIAVNAVAVGLIDTERQREHHAKMGGAQPYAEWLSSESERRRVP